MKSIENIVKVINEDETNAYSFIQATDWGVVTRGYDIEILGMLFSGIQSISNRCLVGSVIIADWEKNFLENSPLCYSCNAKHEFAKTYENLQDFADNILRHVVYKTLFQIEQENPKTIKVK